MEQIFQVEAKVRFVPKTKVATTQEIYDLLQEHGFFDVYVEELKDY